MKIIHFVLLLLASIFLIACSSKTNNESRDVIKKNTSQKKDLSQKIDSAICEMIIKYDLPHELCKRKFKDSVIVDNPYPLVKKTYYPAFDLTIEHHPYCGDCHVSIELIVCIVNDVVSCIPFYGKSYYQGHFESKSSDYTDVLENELNISFEKLNRSFEIDTLDFRADLFSQVFAKYILEGIETYRLNFIENSNQLESIKSRTNKYKFEGELRNISKSEALRNIDKVAENINKFEYSYYSIWDSMIIEVKTNKEEKSKKMYELRTINYEFFQEFIL